MSIIPVSATRVAVVRQVLSDEEVQSLNIVCNDEFSKISHNDLCDRSCALDPFEDIQLSDRDIARTDKDAYMAKRMAATSSDYKDILEKVLFKTLPRLLTQLQGWDSVYLFNEHFVVKPSESSVSFGWHTDAEKQLDSILSCGRSVPQYCAVWCPLVDANVSNGALAIPAEGVIVDRLIVQNGHLSHTNVEEMLCDAVTIDDIAARVLSARAGDVIVFSSNTLHCSGVNSSSEARNVFYAQYSVQPISADATSQTPLAFAVKCDIGQ